MYFCVCATQIATGTPVGILPTLEIEDKTLSGTVTVSRFLSEKYGKLRSEQK